MESINILIEKYFNGETTLQEENILKNYFKSEKVEASHEIYRPLFEVFQRESEEIYQPKSVKVIDYQPTNRRRNWLQIASISGVAATVLLAIWFLHFNTDGADYAVVNGKRINDAEYAQKIAQAKVDKVNDVLGRSFKPMGSFKKVRRSLEPVNKLSEVRLNLNEIENKLNFK